MSGRRGGGRTGDSGHRYVNFRLASSSTRAPPFCSNAGQRKYGGPPAEPGRGSRSTVQGKVGGDLTLEQGIEAARLVGLNILATVRTTLGSLDKVKRLVKTLGMVNGTPGFLQHPQVINGFSELMAQVFGEDAGVGA